MGTVGGGPHEAGGGGPHDEIRLTALRVVGTHGVLAEEQTRAQPFQVDVVLSLDLSAASTSDALDDTIDYGEVAGVAAAIVANEHFALLERLAGRVAEALLALDERIDRVEVTVTKLRPPVPVDLGSAGVRLVRPRRA
jgi:dihydroneopterin aldolase